VAEGAPAPVSEARRRLAKLLIERDGAASEMSAIQGSLRKLALLASAVPPLVARLDLVRAGDAEAYRLWSELDTEAPAPEPNEEGASLSRQIDAAKLSADTAATAVPLKDREFVAASNRHAAVTHSINAAIGEILLEEVEPDFVAIVEAKASLAAAIARAEHGRDLALRGCEAIPNDRRPTLAAQFYAALGKLETVRTAAMSNPPASYDRGGWAEFSRRLAVDHQATLAEGA